MEPAGGTWREEIVVLDSKRVWVGPMECKLEASGPCGEVLIFTVNIVLKRNNFKAVKKATEEKCLGEQD